MLILISMLTSCGHKPGTGSKTDTVTGKDTIRMVVLQVSDTAKVIYTYRASNNVVMCADGFYVQSGLKAKGSKEWAAAPTPLLLDASYKPVTMRPITINAR